MDGHPDLADPDFEPTDEQLGGLMSRAFAGVADQNRQSLARLRAEIVRERERALRDLEERQSRPRSTP